MILGDIKYHDEKHEIWRRVNRNNTFRQNFLKGKVSFVCHWCGELITKLKGKDSDSFAMHHINKDQGDNRPENRLYFHYGCHIKYHASLTKRVCSEQLRKKMSMGMKAWHKRKREEKALRIGSLP